VLNFSFRAAIKLRQFHGREKAQKAQQILRCMIGELELICRQPVKWLRFIFAPSVPFCGHEIGSFQLNRRRARGKCWGTPFG
jgi:hypothetical protein